MERSGGGRLISGMQTVAPWEHLPWSGVPWAKSGAWLASRLTRPGVSTRGSVTVVLCWSYWSYSGCSFGDT